MIGDVENPMGSMSFTVDISIILSKYLSMSETGIESKLFFTVSLTKAQSILLKKLFRSV
ncbi:hypothetical protein D3C86_2226940 [compost metagenome]